MLPITLIEQLYVSSIKFFCLCLKYYSKSSLHITSQRITTDKSSIDYMCSVSLYFSSQSDPVKLKRQVNAMCHQSGHIWLAYDDGTLAVCDANNYIIVKTVVVQKLPIKPVAVVGVEHSSGLVAVAYLNGLIVFLWTESIISTDDPAMKYYHSSTTITIPFKLNTIETCSVANGHSQLWCSYDIGVIQIVKPPVSTSGETEVVKVVEIKEYCTDLPHDTSIVQLKCSPNQDHKSSVMYALHDGGLAISCWSVDVDPKLYTIIKPSLNSPGKIAKCMIIHNVLHQV